MTRGNGTGKGMSKKRLSEVSLNYKSSLKRSIHNGDIEGIIKAVMLLAVKNNADENWKMGPRTFMELATVLVKLKELGYSAKEFDGILSILDFNSKDNADDDRDKDAK